MERHVVFVLPEEKGRLSAVTLLFHRGHETGSHKNIRDKPKKKIEEPRTDSGLYLCTHYLGTISVVCEDSNTVVDMYIHSRPSRAVMKRTSGRTP